MDRPQSNIVHDAPYSMSPVDSAEGVLPPISTAISYPVLDPNYGPQTVHRSDLFFANSPQSARMSARQSTEPSRRTSSIVSPSISTQLYPYHLQGFHQYYSPQAQQNAYSPTAALPSYEPSAPPPVPPKPTSMPIVYPPIRTATSYEQYANTSTSSPPRSATRSMSDYTHHEPPSTPTLPTRPPVPQPALASVPEDDTINSPADELALALALSQSESNDRRRREEQEEEDLARALAESMLTSGTQENFNFLPPSPVLESSSLAVVDNGNTRNSSTPVPDESRAPSRSSVSGSSVTCSTEAPTSFLEFGHHDKWHIPGVGNSHNEESELDVPLESSANASNTLAFPTPSHESFSNASSRRASIASASSLPYTRDEPISEQSDIQPRTPSVAEIQDGQNYISEPASADRPQSSSRIPFPEPLPSGSLSVPVNVPYHEEEIIRLVLDDEAYARQLAAEEEEMARLEEEQRQRSNEKGRPPGAYPEEVGQSLPIYQEGTWPTPSVAGSSTSGSRRPSSSTIASSSLASVSSPSSPAQPQPPPGYSAPLYGLNELSESPEFDFRQISSLTSAGPSTSPYVPFQSGPVVYPSLGPRRESDSDTRSDVSHQSSNHSSASAPPAPYSTVGDVPSRYQGMRRPSLGEASSAPLMEHGRPAGAAPSLMRPTSLGVLNANHFLDPELLLGVSIGFKPPAISTSLLPMQDPMPNMISLPYARCPPLHLQAPDWRHLLRLMARLSGTRIEPTVEAMAVSKTDLKLRTVVQFIKPHAHSRDWRTILWFTIDHPVPPSAPGATRYQSGNPNLLPWSYTLSPVPMLLRDATDSPLSKTYTIPSTDKVPLPTLPITFPNLALYLQAALDDSRRHSGDTSSGFGKLGKIVQMCYPSIEESHSEFDPPDRSSVTHLFKRVIGRGNKDRKKGKSTNEETYQLVTPFVPDEWG